MYWICFRQADASWKSYVKSSKHFEQAFLISYSYLLLLISFAKVYIKVFLKPLLTTSWEVRIRFCSFVNSFFFLCGSSFNHSQITGLEGKGEGISLTPYYHFHPVHRHLDISRAITAESSPLHIGSSQTRTGNLWFPSVSC